MRLGLGLGLTLTLALTQTLTLILTQTLTLILTLTLTLTPTLTPTPTLTLTLTLTSATAPWVSKGGRAVLLGDAAHAMAPFLGQGANQAIQDGYCLASCLAGARAGDLSFKLLGPLQRYTLLRRAPVTALQVG